MDIRLLRWICCPRCRGELAVSQAGTGASGQDISRGVLRCQLCQQDYPIVAGIPDFTSGPATPTQIAFATQWRLKSQGAFERHGLTYYVSDRVLMRRVLEPFAEPLGRDGTLLLDAGCGIGHKTKEVARLFPHVDVIGVDFALLGDEANRLRQGSPKLHFFRASIEALPFRGAVFDIILCHGVLHHLRRQQQGFSELVRVAKPGGRLSLWLYPRPADMPLSMLKLAHILYYGARDVLCLRSAHRFGPSFCYTVATCLALLLTPVNYLLSAALFAPYARRWEGEDYRRRGVLDAFRHLRFLLFDALIPECQTRYGIREVQAMAEAAGCHSCVSFNDDPPAEVMRCPGFYLAVKKGTELICQNGARDAWHTNAS